MATPHSVREGRGLVTFAVCTEILFTHTEILFTRIVLALRPHTYLEKTDEAMEQRYSFVSHTLHIETKSLVTLQLIVLG